MEGFLDPQQILASVDIREDMRVADFGCGAGHFTVLIGKKVGSGGRVTALDVQEAPLETVRAKAKSAGLENIDTVRANLEVLGSSMLADSSQDAVLMANILFQSPKKESVIQEAKRILKSGGQLIVVEWKKGAGGPGLPDSYRMEESQLITTIQQEGLTHERTAPAGNFHVTLIFRKG